MFRTAAIALITATVVSTAHAGDLTDLSADLEHYIAEFDLAAMDQDSLETVSRIMADTSTSHGHKVLALHTLLDRNGALGHADMHGARNLLTAEMR